MKSEFNYLLRLILTLNVKITKYEKKEKLRNYYLFKVL
jgi:hypothetical protein